MNRLTWSAAAALISVLAAAGMWWWWSAREALPSDLESVLASFDLHVVQRIPTNTDGEETLWNLATEDGSSSALVRYRNGHAFGTGELGDGRAFRIFTPAAGLPRIEFVPSVPVSCGVRGDHDRGGPADPLAPESDTGLAVIDVALLYTRDALNGSAKTDIRELFKKGIDRTNKSFTCSSVRAQLRQVGEVTPLPFEHTGRMKDFLEKLVSRDTKEGHEVWRVRSDVAADIVMVLIDDGEHAGLANAPVAGMVAGWRDAAVALVTADDEGQPAYTFAHEIGHLMGAGHEPGKGKGITDYAQAWTDHLFFTVLATAGRVRTQYFSNPDVTISPTIKPGTKMQNNARVMRETRRLVEAWSESKQSSEEVIPLECRSK